MITWKRCENCGAIFCAEGREYDVKRRRFCEKPCKNMAKRRRAYRRANPNPRPVGRPRKTE